MDPTGERHLVSSAKRNIFVVVTEVGISFTNMRKSSGPRSDLGPLLFLIF